MSQDPPLAASGPAMAGGPVTIRVEQVALLSVTGQLDEPGLDRLQCRIDGLLDDGVRLLLADLSGVAGCDGGCSACSPGLSTSSSESGVGCGWSGWRRRC